MSTTPTEGLLETTGLEKQFGSLVAVDSLDLTVPEGEIRGVIGPNGAGKTTLFNLITGVLPPTAGTVVFDGEDVTDRPPEERIHRGMVRSFQVTEVFDSLTVRENVRLAVQSDVYDQVSGRQRLFGETASLDGVAKRTDALLSKTDLATQAEELADSLSHGDKRRLEIGIVLATDPELVLLDEPMAGVSSSGTRAMTDLIEEMADTRTVVLIEHDIDLVMDLCDRITVLNRGAKIAEGAPDEIANDSEVRKAYLGGETDGW